MNLLRNGARTNGAHGDQGDLRQRACRIALALLLIAASPASAWVTYLQNHPPGPGEETIEGMVFDGSDGLYVTGRLSNGSTVPLTAKLSATTGAELWRVTGTGSFYNGDILLAGGAVVVGQHVPAPGGTRLDPADGSVLAGTIPHARIVDGGGNVIAAPNDSPQVQFTLVKYDPTALTPIWTSSALGTGMPASRLALAVDASNNVYAAGSMGLTSFADNVWIVAKVSGADGTTAWTQELSVGGLRDYGNKVSVVKVGSDGAVYVAGTLMAAVPPPENIVPQLTVKRLNGATGAVEWTYNLTGATNTTTVAAALAFAANGDVIVGGQVSAASGPLPCGGGEHQTVARVNVATGTEVWKYSGPGECSEGTNVVALAVDGADNIYAGGRRYELYNNGSGDGRQYANVLKLDPDDGTVIWERSYLGVADGFLQVLILNGTTIYIAGRGDGSTNGSDMMVAALTTGGGDYPCGNGVVDAGETCDDANAISCDGCDSTCQLESGPLCGDGIANFACGEHCDDGNLTPGDGCSELCEDQALPETVSTTAAPNVPVSSDSESDGATEQDPLETAVTSPAGGKVVIKETTNPAFVSPTGYSILSQLVSISAPASTPTTPLAISFLLDSSRVPVGETAATLAVFRNGIVVADCAGGPGQASPDPCVSSRALQGDDLEFTVLTSHASLWYLGIETPADVPVAVKQVVIRDSEPDTTKRSISLLARDAEITPTDLSCSGPGGGGATLVVSGTDGAASEAFNLPCANWKAVSNPKKGLVAAVYHDPDQSEGPCKTVLVKRLVKLGVVKALCTAKNPASPIDYDLTTDAPQLGVGFRFDDGANRFCGSIILPGSDTKTLFKAVAPRTGTSVKPTSCY